MNPLCNIKSTKYSKDLSQLVNNFWLICTSITTVGYGDYYPNTYLGSILVFSAYLIGLFLISLAFASIVNFFDFS